jgi:hypothetical protein
MQKFFHAFLFIAIISQGVSLIDAAPRQNLTSSVNLEKYTALGSGESVTLTKDELSDLLGQEKTDEIFQEAQVQVKQHEDDRLWTAIKTGLTIGTVVAVLFICKIFSKK